MKRTLLSMIPFLCMGSGVYGQDTNPRDAIDDFVGGGTSQFDIHGGFSFPLSDFKRGFLSDGYIMADDGVAQAGFTIGLSYHYDIPKLEFNVDVGALNLGIYGGIDVLRHKLKKKERTKYEQNIENTFDPESNYDAEVKSVKHAVYYNIPLSIGGALTFSPSNNNHSYYLNFGPLLNILKTTDFNSEYTYHEYNVLTGALIESTDYYETIDFSLSARLGWKFGIGVILNDRFRIGMDYQKLGSHEREYSSYISSLDFRLDSYFTTDVKVFNLGIGLRLGD